MKRCLVDVNVLFAVLVRQHGHHRAARKWFDGLAAGEAGLCRFVQLAVMRLLGNRTVMGEHAIPAATAWTLLAELLEDERIDFVGEPAELEAVFPTLLRHAVPTPKLTGAAYLAAFAIADGRRLVTLDAGFRQFGELEVELVRAEG